MSELLPTDNSSDNPQQEMNIVRSPLNAQLHDYANMLESYFKKAPDMNTQHEQYSQKYGWVIDIESNPDLIKIPNVVSVLTLVAQAEEELGTNFSKQDFEKWTSRISPILSEEEFPLHDPMAQTLLIKTHKIGSTLLNRQPRDNFNPTTEEPSQNLGKLEKLNGALSQLRRIS